MKKNITEILDPNRSWVDKVDAFLKTYRRVYGLSYIRNSEEISPAFYNYCLKGKYFVVIALYNSKKEFFVQRDFTKRGKGWELIGGWLQKSELFDQAIDRIVEREAGNSLMEAIPISLVKNSYFTADGKKINHLGVAFLGRVIHDSATTQDGVFSKNPEKFLNKGDIKILTLGRKILRHTVNRAPIEEVTVLKPGFISVINRYIVKPLAYHFSSRVLSRRIYENVISVEKDNRRFLLDVACGDDESILKIAEVAKLVVANDISRRTMSDIIKHSTNKRIIFTNQNLLGLNFQMKFDVVICKNTLHHMRDPGEVELLFATLKRLGKRIIIMDVEDPRQNFLARLWNNYYVKLLKDQGAFFITFQQFREIIKLFFSDTKKVLFEKIRTIKGVYMLAVIDQ